MKPITILVAEDEGYERATIERLVREHFSGNRPFELWVAENGKSALSHIETHTPDLLLLDIRMPGIEGIELAQRAKELKPESVVAFITAYSYFQYAQQALRLGARDFLVKPFSDDDFHALLQRMIETTDSGGAPVVGERAELVPFAEEAIVSRLISGSPPSPEVVTATRDWIKKFRGRYWVVVLRGRIDPTQLASQMPYLFDDRAIKAVFELHQAVLLVGQQAADHLESGVAEKAAIRVKCALQWSGPHANIALVPIVYNRLVQRHTDASPGARVEHVTEIADTIVRTVLSGSTTGLARDAVARILRASGGRDDTVYQTLRDVSNLVLARLHRELDFAVGEFSFSFDENASGGLATATDELDAVCRKIDERLQKTLGDRTSQAVAQAEVYVRDNLSGDLSLSAVATRVGLSGAHFSRVFHRLRGHTFHQFVNRARVSAATLYLDKPGASIKEIAYRVGFSSPSQLSRVFRRELGISPSEYAAGEFARTRADPSRT
ncbi:MAG: helix-turn-helix domain-containing protein [Spirochaetales bacterium]